MIETDLKLTSVFDQFAVLIQACGGKIPSYMVPSVGEVFWEMLNFNKEVGYVDCF